MDDINIYKDTQLSGSDNKGAVSIVLLLYTECFSDDGFSLAER